LDFCVPQQGKSPPLEGAMPNVAVQKINDIFIGFGSVLSRNRARLDHTVGRIKRPEKWQSQAKRWLD
jgi:hypothetical protein